MGGTHSGGGAAGDNACVGRISDCSYGSGKNSPEKVLMRKFGEMLPMYSPKELQKMTGEIVAAVHKNQELRQSLQEAVGRGETREKWFGGQVQHVMEGMTVNETVLPYLKTWKRPLTMLIDLLSR